MKLSSFDGQTAEHSANIIAEKMYAQCDAEGNQYLLLKEIVDWKKSSFTTAPADMYITRGFNRHFRKTTEGWHLCVEWKDATTSWERLTRSKLQNLRLPMVCRTNQLLSGAFRIR